MPNPKAKIGRRHKIQPITPRGERQARLVRMFMGQYVVHMKGKQFVGKPFLLEPWQYNDIIRPLFGTLDAKGNRIYREAVIGLPRDGGKSELAAAIVITCAFLEPEYEGEYVVVARNKKQAGIVFNKMRRMILQNPELRAACDVMKSEIVIRDTGARIYAVPWDAGSAQGIHAQVCVIDEYHVHRDDSMRNAMLSGMIEGDGLLITISTAGPKREGPLWDLLQSAARDPRALVVWYGAGDDDDAHDPKVWRKANPQSWITAKMLRDAHRTLPPWEFERYHLNRFPLGHGSQRAFRDADWLKCLTIPRFDPDLPCFVGVDVAPKRDTTAIVLDQRDEEGFHNLRTWVFRPDESEGHLDWEAMEQLLRDLWDDFYVEQILCDPSHMERSMAMLASEGLVIVDVPQNDSQMIPAADALYDIIRRHAVRAGDPRRSEGTEALSSAIRNCGVYEKPPRGWRIAKVSDAEKIDAAIAFAMAARAAELHAANFAAPFVIAG
jgi:phage terminase large subunit-like protein